MVEFSTALDAWAVPCAARSSTSEGLGAVGGSIPEAESGRVGEGPLDNAAGRRHASKTTRETVAAQAVSRLPTPWTNIASVASQPSAKPGGSQADVRSRGPIPSLSPFATARSCRKSRSSRGRQADVRSLL